ncbi:putative Ig domain-containing protein [Actinoplanes sp. URMC 104]|uniref:putative Ig domain-containing protein n=1 Tax=Actinoplanes sp. URMC 104 TaxID=3423409 RepID=UPI003F19A9E5
MRRGPGRLRGDEGFTVIEVMLALTLLATTMAAMGPFFVSSFQFIARQSADQAAIQLANSAIEQVRALKGSSLLSGRSEAKSTEQWRDAFENGPEAMKAYLAVPGLASPAGVNRKLTMRLAWDTTISDVDAGEDAAISILPQEMARDTTVYTRSIFVGECNVYLMNLPGYPRSSGDCVNPDVVPPPSADDPRVLQFFRAVVLVTWTDKKCPANRCSQIASTLISRASEPTFDFNRPAPQLFPQTATFYVGKAGEYVLQASGGQLPNTYRIAANLLPPGLTLDGRSGKISGTPTTARTYSNIAVTVTDDLGRSDPDRPVLTIVVLAPPSVMVPADPRNIVGDTVRQTVSIMGGVRPYIAKVTNLPPGLTTDLGPGGATDGTITISGVPASPGRYTVTVDVTDSEGGTATGSYTHIIFSPVQLIPLPDRTITLGSTFSATATGVGGDSTYTYKATGLPVGVTIDSRTGAMSGLATVPGSYLVTVTVTDGLGSTFSQPFTLTVTTSTALYLTSPGNQTSAVGDNVKLDLQSNSGLLGLKPTYSVTGLPDGLRLNQTQGSISGRATTAGTYVVTVTGTNLVPPQSSSVTFLWTVT